MFVVSWASVAIEFSGFEKVQCFWNQIGELWAGRWEVSFPTIGLIQYPNFMHVTCRPLRRYWGNSFFTLFRGPFHSLKNQIYSGLCEWVFLDFSFCWERKPDLRQTIQFKLSRFLYTDHFNAFWTPGLWIHYDIKYICNIRALHFQNLFWWR